jgi:hypothetical protein
MLQEKRKQRSRDRRRARKHGKEDDRGASGLKRFFFVVHLKSPPFSSTRSAIAGKAFSRPAESRLELVVII